MVYRTGLVVLTVLEWLVVGLSPCGQHRSKGGKELFVKGNLSLWLCLKDCHLMTATVIQ